MKKFLILSLLFLSSFVFAQKIATPYISTSHSTNITHFEKYKNFLISASSDRTIKVWDIQKKILIRTFFKHKASIYYMKLIPNSSKVVSIDETNKLFIWDIQTNEILKEHDINIFKPAISMLKNENLLMMVKETKVEILDLKTLRIKKLNNQTFYDIFPKITSDKKRENITIGIYPNKIVNINLTSGKTNTATLNSNYKSIKLSNNGKLLLNATENKIELYSTSDYKLLRQLDLKTNVLSSFSFSSDDKSIAISSGYKVDVYEVKSLKKIYEKNLYEQVSKGALNFIDENSLAVGFKDGNIRILNIKENNGFEFDTYNKTVSKVQVSKDGKTLYSSINNKQIFKVNNQTKDYYALTDYITTKEEKLYTKLNDGNITAMYLNKDFYIFGNFSGELVLWDIKKQKQIKKFKPFDSSVRKIELNGKRILSYSQKGKIKVLNSSDFKELFSLKKEEFAIRDVKFDNSGKYLLLVDNKGIKVLNKNYKEVYTKDIKTHSISDVSFVESKIRYLQKVNSGDYINFEYKVIEEDIDTKTIKELYSFTNEEISYYKFSNDSNRIAFVKDNKYKVLDLKTKEIKDLKIKTPFSSFTTKLHFSYDDKLMALVENDYLNFYSVKNGEFLDKYLLHKVDKEDIHSIFRPFNIEVSLSKDENRFVSSAKKREYPKFIADYMNIWNLDTLNKPKKLNASRYTLSINDFDIKDDELIYVSNGSIKNYKSFKSKNEYKSFYGVYTKLQRYKDKYILAINNDNSIELIDIKTKKLLHKIKPLYGIFTYARFSPDGKSILASSSNLWPVSNKDEKQYTFVLYSTKTGKVTHKLDSYGANGLNYFDISSDNKTLVVSASGRSALFDMSKKDSFKFLDKSLLSLTSAFKKDKYIVVGTFDGLVNLYTKKGELIHSFEAHEGRINSVSFHPNKPYIISSGDDGMVKFWHINKKELVASFISFDNEWLVITKEGYFSGSINAAKKLNVLSDSMNSISMEKVYDVFFRPDLVKLKLLDIDISKYIKDVRLDEVVKSLAPNIYFTKFENKQVEEKTLFTSKEKVNLSFKVEEQNAGVGLINIFHEGKLIKTIGEGKVNKIDASLDSKVDEEKRNEEYKDKQKQIIAALSKSLDNSLELDDNIETINRSSIKNESKEYSIDIDLVSGENSISIQVYNEANTMASITKSIKIKANLKKRKRTLHAIVFGVNEFEVKNVSNLNYSINDASDVKKALEYYGSSLFDEVKIYSLLAKDARLDKINEAIKSIQEKAKLEDTVVLYMSTHGRSTKNGALYLVPQNNKSFKQWINFESMFKSIQKAKALNQIFVIDACESGQASDIISSIYDSKVSSMAKKAGVHVLMATTKGTFAFEHPDKSIKNGVFTYSILDTLKQNSTDLNKNGKVSIKELSKALKDLDSNLQYQYPVIRNIGNDVDLKDTKKVFK